VCCWLWILCLGRVYRRLGDKTFGRKMLGRKLKTFGRQHVYDKTFGRKTFGRHIRGTFGRKLRTFGGQHLYDILWDVWEKTIGPFGDKKISECNLGRSCLSNLLRNVIQRTSVEVWKCNVKERYHTKSHVRVIEINV